MLSPERDELLEQLRQVGLNRYESAVYLGLLTDADAKVSEISKRTGVPPPKTYQALDALVEKGFCALGPDGVNRFRPIRPEVAIAGYIERLREAEQSAHLLIGALTTLHESGIGQQRWAPPIEIAKGRRQVAEEVVKRIEAAEREIRVFGKLPFLLDDPTDAALVAARDRGIRLRTVLERAFLEHPDVVASRERMRRYGGEHRFAESVPVKLLVVDDAVAMAPLDVTGADGFLVLSVRHRELVTLFQSAFEACWERASPYSFDR